MIRHLRSGRPAFFSKPRASGDDPEITLGAGTAAS